MVTKGYRKGVYDRVTKGTATRSGPSRVYPRDRVTHRLRNTPRRKYIRMRNIAKKFNDQPLVLLSVSLDNEQRWKDFVAKNQMTWPQYRDGGFTGPLSKMFGVQAIPHTFTIDADGVLQDEHIGDAAIEGKLKKLLSRARELEAAGRLAQQ
ncbi:MAG TPA: TlpA disulfide reductase family protein [Terriglobales bacterium]|nr:TlpA disulfide reductase family protein [Terriglobales bacterium]